MAIEPFELYCTEGHPPGMIGIRGHLSPEEVMNFLRGYYDDYIPEITSQTHGFCRFIPSDDEEHDHVADFSPFPNGGDPFTEVEISWICEDDDDVL